MSRLAGKVALITGASSGLGRVGAELFAAQGAQVVIADLTDGDEAVEAIASAGGDATYVRCDVTDPQSIEAAVHTRSKRRWSARAVQQRRVMLRRRQPCHDVDETIRRRWTSTCSVCCSAKHAIPAMQESEESGESADRERRLVRCPHGCRHPAGCVHGVQGAVLAMTRDRRSTRKRAPSRAVPGPDHDPALGRSFDDAKRNRRLVHIRWGAGEPSRLPTGALPGVQRVELMTGQSLIIDGGITATSPPEWKQPLHGTNSTVAISTSAPSRGSSNDWPTLRSA